jgi:hypothetical protein
VVEGVAGGQRAQTERINAGLRFLGKVNPSRVSGERIALVGHAIEKECVASDLLRLRPACRRVCQTIRRPCSFDRWSLALRQRENERVADLPATLPVRRHLSCSIQRSQECHAGPTAQKSPDGHTVDRAHDPVKMREHCSPDQVRKHLSLGQFLLRLVRYGWCSLILHLGPPGSFHLKLQTSSSSSRSTDSATIATSSSRAASFARAPSR